MEHIQKTRHRHQCAESQFLLHPRADTIHRPLSSSHTPVLYLRQFPPSSAYPGADSPTPAYREQQCQYGAAFPLIRFTLRRCKATSSNGNGPSQLQIPPRVFRNSALPTAASLQKIFKNS